MDLRDKINKLSLQAQTTPLGTTCDTRLLFEVLNEVEEILDVNPNEALKHFNHFEKWYRKICYRVVTSFELDYDLEIIKRYILKTQEQENVLKIIFEKNVDIDFLKSADTFEEYNKLVKTNNCFAIELTQEEFNTLKEMIK